MHELSIVNNLMPPLLRAAEEQGAVRIVEVELMCGVLQQVVPDALEMAFEAVAHGTIAEGAQLRVEEEALAGRCRNCKREYAPSIDDYICPNCGRAEPELTAGRDIVLKSVVCELPDEAVA